MINPDQFHTVAQTAAILGVSESFIYHACSGLQKSNSRIEFPKPIKVGRGVRFWGKQILAYQARLAAASGVDLADLDTPPAPAPTRRAPGRPRNTVAMELAGGVA